MGLQVLDTHLKRLGGLAVRRKCADVFLMTRCADVHTFGMRYPIDIAFVDGRGFVVASYRNVGSGCRLRVKRAAAVLERAYDPRVGWFRAGSFSGMEVARAMQAGIGKGKEQEDERMPSLP